MYGKRKDSRSAILTGWCLSTGAIVYILMDNYTLLLPWTATASVITVQIPPLPPRNQEAPPPHPPYPQLELSVTADPNTCACAPPPVPNPVVIKHIFKGRESSQKCSLPNFGGSRSSLSCLLFLWYIKQFYKQPPPSPPPPPDVPADIYRGLVCQTCCVAYRRVALFLTGGLIPAVLARVSVLAFAWKQDSSLDP